MGFSLYRSYLRQIRLLPHLYLRQFFKIKARDDVKTILTTKDARLRAHRIASVSKSVNLVSRANMGEARAFDRVLDLAYGRKGKLRWELMKPLLSDPSAPLPQHTINVCQDSLQHRRVGWRPGLPICRNSRPPVYSPVLKALLTSAYSRTTKPLKLANLVNPPVLPARADPSSLDARIFGLLSKRREVNIRRRYFASEWKKVFPPIEVHVGPNASTFEQSAKQLVPGFGMQIGVFADIEHTAGTLNASRPPLRRERPSEQSRFEPRIKAHSSWWLRRRYRSLLNRLPILLYKPSDSPQSSGSFSVQRSELSLPPYQRPIPYLPEVDSTSLAWLETPVTK